MLASTHVDPEVGLARDSNLEIDDATGGVATNAAFEAHAGFFVAGNAASYYDAALGKRRRLDLYVKDIPRTPPLYVPDSINDRRVWVSSLPGTRCST